MSTVADWDSDVDARVEAVVTTAMSKTALRYGSDLRRGRIEAGEVKFQIRHGQQGVDDSLDSSVGYPKVATEIEIFYRLDVGETERDYTIVGMRLLQATLSLESTWRAETSCYRVEESLVGPPEAVSDAVVGFQISLLVLLAP